MLIAKTDVIAARQTNRLLHPGIVAVGSIAGCEIEKFAFPLRMNQDTTMASGNVLRIENDVVVAKSANRVESDVQGECHFTAENQHKIRFCIFDQLRMHCRLIDM